jgi:CRP-like cAMP-binding protein
MWGGSESRIAEYRTVPLLEGCSPTELRRVAGASARLNARAGTVLVNQGRRPGQFVIVLAGAAEVRRGGRQIDEITPGGYFGEIGLMRGIREPATIVARTDMNIDVISRHEFRALYADVALLRHRIESELDQRLATWHQAAGLTLEQRDTISPAVARPIRPLTVASPSTRSRTPRCRTRR